MRSAIWLALLATTILVTMLVLVTYRSERPDSDQINTSKDRSASEPIKSSPVKSPEAEPDLLMS